MNSLWCRGILFGLLLLAPWVAFGQQFSIMPIGDSITQGVRGQCGYRRVLSQALADNNQCSINFVGGRTAVGDSNSDDVLAACAATNTNHEAVPGARADFFIPTRIEASVNQFEPDIAIVHLGSNDVFQGQSVSSTVDDVDAVISDILAAQPAATILLLNVIPWAEFSPNANFQPFVQPDINMRQVTAQLSGQLANLAQTRTANGDDVVLVDVREGFSSDTMTVDGVHPNENGENHIAYRILDALYDKGFCGNSSTPLPRLILPSNVWVQVSLPGNPGVNDTVADIFSELPAGSYGNSNASNGWVLYQYDGIGGYDQLDLDSFMDAGVGYWALQISSNDISIAMPAGSTPALLIDTPECASPSGCFTTGFDFTSSEELTYNMPGYPLAVSRPYSNTRIVTSTGPCRGGCSPSQAESNNIAFNRLFTYAPNDPNAENTGYLRYENNDALIPWQGFWAATLPDAFNNNPLWLIGPD